MFVSWEYAQSLGKKQTVVIGMLSDSDPAFREPVS